MQNTQQAIISLAEFKKLSPQDIIKLFGGIRPMAKKLGLTASTVQGWRERKHIPEGRWEDIYKCALSHNLCLEKNESSQPSSLSNFHKHTPAKSISAWPLRISVCALTVSLLVGGYVYSYFQEPLQNITSYQQTQASIIELENKIDILTKALSDKDRIVRSLDSDLQNVVHQIKNLQLHQDEYKQSMDYITQLMSIVYKLEDEITQKRNIDITEQEKSEQKAEIKEQPLDSLLEKQKTIIQKVNVTQLWILVQQIKKKLHNTSPQNFDYELSQLQKYRETHLDTLAEIKQLFDQLDNMDKSMLLSFSEFQESLRNVQSQEKPVKTETKITQQTSLWTELQTYVDSHFYIKDKSAHSTPINYTALLENKKFENILTNLKTNSNELSPWQETWVNNIQSRLDWIQTLDHIEEKLLRLMKP